MFKLKEEFSKKFSKNYPVCSLRRRQVKDHNERKSRGEGEDRILKKRKVKDLKKHALDLI